MVTDFKIAIKPSINRTPGHWHVTILNYIFSVYSIYYIIYVIYSYTYIFLYLWNMLYSAIHWKHILSKQNLIWNNGLRKHIMYHHIIIYRIQRSKEDRETKSDWVRFWAVCAHSYKFLISHCLYIAIPNKFALKMLGMHPNDTLILILKTMNTIWMHMPKTSQIYLRNLCW
jgi:hypothetical protein